MENEKELQELSREELLAYIAKQDDIIEELREEMTYLESECDYYREMSDDADYEVEELRDEITRLEDEIDLLSEQLEEAE